MTQKWSNLNLPGALHFVTGNTRHRIPIFRNPKCCIAFLEILTVLLHDWPCKLIAFVIMLDHFHLIVNPRDGNIKGFIGALKSLTATKIVDVVQDERLKRRKPDSDGSMHEVWQESLSRYRYGVCG